MAETPHIVLLDDFLCITFLFLEFLVTIVNVTALISPEN